MVRVRPILSVFLSLVLIAGGVPTVAIADPVDGQADITDSELSSSSGNNAGSEQLAEEEPGFSEKDASTSIDESTQDSGSTVQDEETDGEVANSNEVDPDSENS